MKIREKKRSENNNFGKRKLIELVMIVLFCYPGLGSSSAAYNFSWCVICKNKKGAETPFVSPQIDLGMS